MKKELYDKLITLAYKDDLPGILHVATFDPDIMPSEYLEIVERVDTKKREWEETGK